MDQTVECGPQQPGPAYKQSSCHPSHPQYRPLDRTGLLSGLQTARSTTSLCRRQDRNADSYSAVTAGLGLRLRRYKTSCDWCCRWTLMAPLVSGTHLYKVYIVCLCIFYTVLERGRCHLHTPRLHRVCPLACLQATHVTTCSMTREQDRRYLGTLDSLAYNP
jgi:hypothetical protein